MGSRRCGAARRPWRKSCAQPGAISKMSFLATTSPLKSLLGEGRISQAWRTASRSFASFWAWWKREFFSLFENPFGRRLLGPQRRTLYLKQAGASAIEFHMTGDRSEPETTERFSNYTAETLDRFLLGKGIARQDVDLVVVVPTDRFFGRTLRLPEQTLSNLDQIIAKDLARKTTFKPEDIRSSYEVERGSDSGKITVHHWIIRRSFIAQSLDKFHLGEENVARIEGFGPASYPRVVLNSAAAGRIAWYWTAVRALALALLVLACAAFGLAVWRKQAKLAEFSDKIEASRVKAQSIRAQMDDLDKRQSAVMRVRGDKVSRPNLSDIWEKVTVILPTQSWLTELQLTQSGAGTDAQTLRLTGFSPAAAELVTLFENAGSFADAALTAPVSVDPTERRERFALQMRVRNHYSSEKRAPQ
ncbi:PilN domain-containing protein [Bradyrhizobium sp. CNPSo 4010]|uniref:PilN domain-containing protein n=1 Tax=Bradyrhizobium agreste TaxID=2751811 RepID=A0ABS0Q172_9BRAD|nr:PilN domain-containing protein [Bradyrhizobium agreste]MBH5403171.1 PilN domain-containing protein [Bradyrhizobium agreste]